MRIISGGQIGADIAGLRAAKKLGIDTGGWIPRGFKTLIGPRPDYAELYDLVETQSENYSVRTRVNVKESTCTLRFAVDFGTRGELCTAKAIRDFNKPFFDVPVDMRIMYGMTDHIDPQFLAIVERWINVLQPSIINIAGNAMIDIEYSVEEFLTRVLV